MRQPKRFRSLERGARIRGREGRRGKTLHSDDFGNHRDDEREIMTTKDDPGSGSPAGVIFMCSRLTKGDCFHFKVLGMPLPHRELVERIVPGTILFLFDIDEKELYGIFEAVSYGGLDLVPEAYQDFKGSYPAQVRFDIYKACSPLPEDALRDAIRENYYSRFKFDFELSDQQVARLIRLFCRNKSLHSRVDGPRAPRSLLEERNLIPAYESSPHRFFREDERRGPPRDSAFHPSEVSFHGSRYPPIHPEGQLEGLAGEVFRRFPTQDGGRFSPSLERRRAYEGDYVEPPPDRLYGTRAHMPGLGMLSQHREGDVFHPTQANLLSGADLSNPAALLEPSKMEEVDRLAMKYIQSNPTSIVDHSGPLFAGGPPRDLSAASFGVRNEFMNLRISPWSATQLDPLHKAMALKEELPYPGSHLASGRAPLRTSQTTGRGLLRRSRWDQESNAGPARV